MKKYYFSLLIVVVMFSCAEKAHKEQSIESSKKAAHETNEQVDSLEFMRLRQVAKLLNQMPSPRKMMAVVYETGNEWDKSLLLGAEVNQLPIGSIEKSLVLGATLSDLSYINTYNQPQLTISHMAVVQKLTKELGMPGIVNEETVQRIENSIDDSQKLTQELSEIYSRLSATLKESKRDEIAVALFVGSWIEAYYIGTHLTKRTPALDAQVLSEYEVVKQMQDLLNGIQASSIDAIQVQMKELKDKYPKEKELSAQNWDYLKKKSADLRDILKVK